MVKKNKRNKYAFPASIAAELGADFNGMMLRDYFAARYLEGVLARVGVENEDEVKACVTNAYILADAMMEARDA